MESNLTKLLKPIYVLPEHSQLDIIEEDMKDQQSQLDLKCFYGVREIIYDESGFPIGSVCKNL